MALFIALFGPLEYTFLTLASRMLQVSFAVIGGLSSMKKLTVTADDVKTAVSNALTRAQPAIVSAVDKVFRILTWEDTTLSAKVFGGCLAVSFVSSFLSDFTIVVISTGIAFSVPFLLQNHQKDLAPLVDRAKQAFDGLLSQLELHTKKAKKE